MLFLAEAADQALSRELVMKQALLGLRCGLRSGSVIACVPENRVSVCLLFVRFRIAHVSLPHLTLFQVPVLSSLYTSFYCLGLRICQSRSPAFARQ